MISEFLNRLRALLALPQALPVELRSLERAAQKAAASAADEVSRDARSDRRAVREELDALRAEVRDRMLQYHLQLGRLSALIEGRTESTRQGPRVPLELDEPPVPTPSVGGPTADWLLLDRCPACSTVERTVVCEWNKLALLDSAPDGDSSRYDYAVCHGCAILYATRRPVAGRYRYLVDNFEEVIEKSARNPLLNPRPLTDEDKARYRGLTSRGVFVSDHAPGGEYLRAVFNDRMENAGHVDVLGSLLDPRGWRVLEVRPRAGTILEGLRRLYGAEVYAMPIFESQQFILRELYGIETSGLIDFDRFAIPFDGDFDLIVCNHMFNHAVRLDAFLAALRAKLRPGGHVYLYNEIDDSEFLDGGQSMIATMNPLHLQACDRASLVRALEAGGFEPVFVKGRQKRNICLARRVERPRWSPISSDQLDARIASYRVARDRAVLRAPERLRSRFAAAWPATVERAVASGLARFDESGALRLVKE